MPAYNTFFLASIVGVEAQVRGVDSVGVSAEPAELALHAARVLGRIVSVSGPVDYAFLRDQVVVLDDQQHQLRVFDRAGCQQVGTVAVPPGFEGITPTRGVTLLTQQTGQAIVRTSVVGFAL